MEATRATPIRRGKTLFMTQFAILLALEAIFCFTPLGSLPAIGPIVATLGMIPVIATALLLGTGPGTLMGFFAGLFSFMVWTFMPPPQSAFMAFVFTPFYSIGEFSGNFWSLVICFVPRILVGTVAGATCRAFLKMKGKGKNIMAYGVSAALGSLVNTFLVMGGIYLFFGRDYSAAIGISFELLLGIIGLTVLTSGIPEAIVSALCGYFVCRPVRTILEKSSRSN